MNLQLFFTLYLISLPIYLILDYLWLSVLAKDFYQEKIGHLFGEVNWTAIIVFYLIFLVGLTFFATYPATVAGKITTAVLYGTLFGFFTYLAYDMTNLATLRDWPLSVVIIDVAWGAIVCGAVATLATYIHKLWF